LHLLFFSKIYIDKSVDFSCLVDIFVDIKISVDNLLILARGCNLLSKLLKSYDWQHYVFTFGVFKVVTLKQAAYLC